MKNVKILQAVYLISDSERPYLVNLIEGKATIFPKKTENALKRTGFERVYMSPEIIKIVLRHIRKKFYPVDTDVRTIVRDFHPEELL